MSQDGQDLVMAADTAAIEQHQVAGLSLLLQIIMLGFAFVLGHVLRRHKFYYLHEASASLLIGIIVGGIANVSNKETSFKRWFNFNEEFFFLFLLPPIILFTQSGFNLYAKPFFSNFGAICIFAILGTFLASMVTGILVFLGGFFFLMYKLSFLECLLFGSLISATDPVTVLAIFQELGTDMNLYALVFGESVLNDAMAIALYKTLMRFWHDPSTSYSFSVAVSSFLQTFVGSMGTGVGVALCCALLFKYAGLAVSSLHNLECCLFVLFPYFSFMLAEGLGLSGIIAILFCGILMKHYAYQNLSEPAQAFTRGFFQLLSSLAETFLFIYMGLDIATESHSWSHVGFIFFSIVFILVARAANVFPCAYLVNLIRPAARKIPLKHQKALWYSGLRGAMAFGLALQSKRDLPKKSNGEAIFTTTTAVVVVTVLFIGGSTSTMLERLEVVGDDYAALNEEDPDKHNLELHSPTSSRYQSSPFTAFDKNFLKPIFTSRVEDDDFGLFDAVDQNSSSNNHAAEIQRALIRRQENGNKDLSSTLSDQRNRSI